MVLVQQRQISGSQRVDYNWCIRSNRLVLVTLAGLGQVPEGVDLDLYVLQGDNILKRAEGNTTNELIIDELPVGDYQIVVQSREFEGAVPFRVYAAPASDGTRGEGSAAFRVTGIQRNHIVSFGVVSDGPCDIRVATGGRSIGAIQCPGKVSASFLAPVSGAYDFQVTCGRSDTEWGFVYSTQSVGR